MAARVTKEAPDFTAQAVMPDNHFQELTLSSYRGKYVLLFFYPLDFTFVCPSEIIAFDKAIEKFEEKNTQVLGVSIDSHYTHLAWKNTPRNQGGIGQVRYPLVADLSKSIAKDYGVLHGKEVALRGLFLIDKDTPGISFPKKEKKLGMRGHIHGDVILKDCRVPDKCLIGNPGDGFLIAMKTMDPSRILMSGNAIGVAQEAFDLALSYAKKRIAFGRPIAKHQTISFMLSDMAMEIHLARLITHHTAGLMDQGMERIAKEASMTKLYTADVAMRAADKAMTLFAAQGYTKGTDMPIERLFRDARSFEIMEGTAEIQRLIISRELLR